MSTKVMRLLSLCIGVILISALGFLFLIGMVSPQADYYEMKNIGKDVTETGIFLSLFTSGYFLIAIFGKKSLESIFLRILIGVLLAIPITIYLLIILSTHYEMYFFTIPLLLFSLMAFYIFVWPTAANKNS